MQENGEETRGQRDLEVLRDTSALLRIMSRVLDARVPPGRDVSNNRLSTAHLCRTLAIRRESGSSFYVRVPVRRILIVEAWSSATVGDTDATFS